MAALSQADAKRDFLAVCRCVIQKGERAYVKDKSNRTYLTLDPESRHLSGPVLGISAQFFKDNFSRCSSLIKDGLCFHLEIRGSNHGIYARRHTKYSDACDLIIENWRSRVVIDALAQQQEDKLMQAIHCSARRGEAEHDEIRKAIGELKLGIARLSIGHRPFEEGKLPPDA